MSKAYKFRIYPNEKQRVLLNKSFGNCEKLNTKHMLKNDKLSKK